MNKKILGVGLFAAAAAIAVAVQVLAPGGGGDPISRLVQSARPAEIAVMGFSGSEKMALLDDPAVRERLRADAGIVLDSRKAGSLEMMEPAYVDQGPDFLWPGSAVAVEAAAERGLSFLARETIFTSPIVFYSWAPIAEALEKAGIARPVAGSAYAYFVDAKALLERVAAATPWAKLGLPQLYGGMTIVPTDPGRSNSGAQFAALAAILLGGSGPDLDAGAGRVRTMLARTGYLEHSSGVLFDAYLRNGMGDKPLIVGYENQMIEFARAEPAVWERVLGQAVRPVVLYPEPTVFSAHVMLARTEAGKAMIEAMRTPEVQCVAWTDHGFRAGAVGGACARDIPVPGLPDQVTSVVPMPGAAATARILDRVAP